MQPGSAELTKATATYAVCVVFALTCLVSILVGASTFTSVQRGVIAAIVAHFVSPILLRPAFGAILDALARDRAAHAAASEEEAE